MQLPSFQRQTSVQLAPIVCNATCYQLLMAHSSPSTLPCSPYSSVYCHLSSMLLSAFPPAMHKGGWGELLLTLAKPIEPAWTCGLARSTGWSGRKKMIAGGHASNYGAVAHCRLLVGGAGPATSPKNPAWWSGSCTQLATFLDPFLGTICARI